MSTPATSSSIVTPPESLQSPTQGSGLGVPVGKVGDEAIVFGTVAPGVRVDVALAPIGVEV